jgi:hypothetical protein
MDDGWNNSDGRKSAILEENLVPVLLYSPQNSHGVAWDRNNVSAVRNGRISA